MSNKIFDIPIAIIIYNRPDKIFHLISELSKVKPNLIYVIADGPKEHNKADETKVIESRKMINLISWDCKIEKNFSDTNLGLAKRVTSGLDWVFHHEDKAIILEDDCIPNASFFNFCKYSLFEYQYDTRVQMISGSNIYQENSINSKEDYFFIQSSLIWGWATWRRTWLNYHNHQEIWNNKLKRFILLFKFYNLTKSILSTVNFYRTIIKVYNNKINTWDYQLQNLAIYNNQMCIVPKFNLVKNIGFDGTGTNYNVYDSELLNIPVFDLESIRKVEIIKLNNKITKLHLLSSFPKARPFLYILRKLINF